MGWAARIPTFSAADPYPGASLAVDFLRNFHKIGGYVTSDFASLPGLTVSRASVGYAERSDGTLVQFGNNVARITDKGLLVEESRTNLALQSQTFDNATWTKAGVTVTADQAVAPDGTNTADLIAISAGSNNVGQTQTLTVATYTLSVWAKTSSGTAVFRINYFNGSSSQTSSDFTATTTWQRFSYQVTGAAAAGNVALVNPLSAAATTFLAWGFQLELGSFQTSYIPTAGASATRAADSVSVAISPPAAPFTAVTAFTQGAEAQASTFRRVFSYNDGTASNVADIFVSSTGGLLRQGYTPADYGTQNLGAGNHKVAARFQSGALSVTGDGAAPVTATTVVTATGLNRLQLGVNAEFFVGRFLNNYLRSLVVYPTGFSDAQLQSASQ